MRTKDKTTLIIDGHNFLYRGYYGVPIAAKLPSGREINAVYGFFSLLRNTVKHLNPDELVIVFDTETGIQSKLKEFPEYKAQRQYEETSIFDQLDLIKNILRIRDIQFVESPNHEADDLIGSLISNYNSKDNSIFIGSTDGDFTQLISPRVKIVKSKHNNIELIDESTIYNKYSILPKNYLDFRTLKGDSSDNLGGVKGIGNKIASQLITDYKSLENIYLNFGILPHRIQALLDGKEDYLYKVRKFITIKTDIGMQNFNLNSIQFSSDKIPDHTRKLIDLVLKDE